MVVIWTVPPSLSSLTYLPFPLSPPHRNAETQQQGLIPSVCLKQASVDSPTDSSTTLSSPDLNLDGDNTSTWSELERLQEDTSKCTLLHHSGLISHYYICDEYVHTLHIPLSLLSLPPHTSIPSLLSLPPPLHASTSPFPRK